VLASHIEASICKLLPRLEIGKCAGAALSLVHWLDMSPFELSILLDVCCRQPIAKAPWVWAASCLPSSYARIIHLTSQPVQLPHFFNSRNINSPAAWMRQDRKLIVAA
jgi:hypothetical protein